MKSRSSLFSVVGALASVVLVCALPTASVLAEEVDELTPAAAAAVMRVFPAATVMDVGQEREQGVRYYEVAVDNQGMRIEVEVTPDGSIGEIESVVTLADVPPAARDEVLRTTRGADIQQVERHEVRGVFKDGTFVPVDSPVVLYEVMYEENGRKREFVVTADGSRSPFAEEQGDDSDEDNDEDEEVDD